MNSKNFVAIFALAKRLPTSATLPFGVPSEKMLAHLWSSFFLTYHPSVWWLWVATDSYWIFRKREWTSARGWERCYKLLHNTSLCSPLLLNQLVWKGIHQISCLRDLFIWIALTWDHNTLSDLYANLPKANLSLPCLPLQHLQKFGSDVDNKQM